MIVWELDADGVLLSISPGFEADHRLADGRLDRPARSTDLLPPGDGDPATAMRRRAWDGDRSPAMSSGSGPGRGTAWTASPSWSPGSARGPPERLLEVIRDVTEPKRIARAAEQSEAMRRAKEAAERASGAKSEFLSNVSHEIRTPLTAILGFLELLGEHPHLHGAPSRSPSIWAPSDQNGRFLLALIDDLLDIARIEAGGSAVEREPCSPGAIVADVVESLRGKAEATGLSLEAELAGAIPAAIATDRVRLRQILVNLLDNAIKFTRGGAVRLTVRTRRRDRAPSRRCDSRWRTPASA